MNAGNADALAAPHRACRLTVVIPARNESDVIRAALSALTRQRNLHGQPLERDVFDVIVYANNCSDRTADVARAYAADVAQPQIFVIERDVPENHAHVGAARKYLMDCAAARFLAAGKPHGLIASTDSDTVVDAQWVAWTLHEARHADAVAGHVAIAAADQARLLAPVRLLYTRELAYRRTVAELESLLDPLPEDPWPRHSSFVGASFAVSARAYIAAGKLPPLRRLEDLHFSRALRRIDARLRHSPFVRATTSARVAARVNGGFGTFIAGLHDHAQRGESFFVEHPQQTIDRFVKRAALRGLWQAERTGAHASGMPRSAQSRLATRWRDVLDESPTFGVFAERVTARSVPANFAQVRVEHAIAVLRAHPVGAAGSRLAAPGHQSSAG